MEKVVYKVVYSLYGEYYSSHRRFIYDYESEFCLRYCLGKEIKSVVGKLFVFSDLSKARSFRNEQRDLMIKSEYKNMLIMKGIGKNPSYPKYCCCHPYSEDVTLFWRSKKKHKKSNVVLRMEVVEGTILVDSFIGQEIVE